MQKRTFFILFMLLNNCIVAQDAYTELLADIKKDRLEMAKKSISKDTCRTYIMDRFENDIFPHWIGTCWDYNGYTNVPGMDKLIACGYFVSTTMKHMGFNWNRFELAKMYSSAIVRQSCTDVTEYQDIPSMLSVIQMQPDNLYIVGLDTHVGFILKRGSHCWFIHSNYYNRKGPDKEKAIESAALKNSNRYIVGVLLGDHNIEKWLSGSVFTFQP